MSSVITTLDDLVQQIRGGEDLVRADSIAPLHDALAHLAVRQAIPVEHLAAAIMPPLATRDRATVSYRAWKRAWAEGYPDVADAWKAQTLATPLPLRTRKAWFSHEAELYHLSSALWRHGDHGRWGEAFKRWAQRTPNVQDLVNRTLDGHSTCLLWRLHYRPDLLRVVHDTNVGLDLDLSIERWKAPRSGYLEGVPHDFHQRVEGRQTQAGGWTLLSVAVQQAVLKPAPRTAQDLWAATALELLRLGANPNAPAWDGTLSVAQALHNWAIEQPIPQDRPRLWEDLVRFDLATYGRRVMLDLAIEQTRTQTLARTEPLTRRRL